MGRAKRIPLPVLIVCITLVVSVVAVSVWMIRGGPFHSTQNHGSPVDMTHQARATMTGRLQESGPSPLLFGTNLGLFNSNDQVLRSEPTQTLLQQSHTRIIRMPIRTELPEATEIHAAQIIKDLGAIPVIVLHSVKGPNVLADDTRVVNDMNRIFGNDTVYYEFGNEDDWTGIDATTYTNAWNLIIPQLKHIALHGQFVGPVNFHYDGDYLAAFLKSANPLPDQLSWHEYTCSYTWAADTCIANIDHWTTHIQDSRARMMATIGKVIPIMITEWNYAPDAAYNDGKNNNRDFITTWTTKALRTLAANHIFASMQYSCTNTAISLIDNDNKLTMQGTAFQALYLQMILKGYQPTPTPDPTSTVALSGAPVFSFEDGGTDGWSGHGQGIVQVQNTTAFALDGKHALQVTLSNTSSSDFPYVSVGFANLSSYPHAGQTLTAYIYLPGTSGSITTKIFVEDSTYHWFSNATVSLVPGVWNHLSYTLDSTIKGQPSQIGIQFNSTIGSTSSINVYIDAVGWS